jgi:fumarate reductase iron-sulfur subunit
MSSVMRPLKVKIWRGGQQGAFVAYDVPRLASQSVLDVVTYVQRSIDPSMAWHAGRAARMWPK